MDVRSFFVVAVLVFVFGGLASADEVATSATSKSPPFNPAWRAAELIGSRVYDKAEEEVGDVKDILVSTEGMVVSYVVGFGGFLGIGETYVDISSETCTRVRGSDNRLKLSCSIAMDEIKKMPEFKP